MEILQNWHNRMANVHRFNAARVWHVTDSQRQLTAVIMLVRKCSFNLKQFLSHRVSRRRPSTETSLCLALWWLAASCIGEFYGVNWGTESARWENGRQSPAPHRKGWGIHLKLSRIEKEQGGETPFTKSISRYHPVSAWLQQPSLYWTT